MKTYTARIVKTYRKDVTVKATNEKEAIRFANSKIMQDEAEEVLVKIEVLLEAADAHRGSGR